MTAMTLPEFEFRSPETLEEALKMLWEKKEESAVLAGGTDLLVDMRSRIKRPKLLVDIKRIPELREISYNPETGLVIGAAITLNEILKDDTVRERYSLLQKAVSLMCDSILRNRATLVGNICNASPAADTAPPLLVLDAKVRIASVKGFREVKIEDFFKDVKRSCLEPWEMVTHVIVPDPPKESKGTYLKAGRTKEDLAIVGVAALACKDDGKRVRIAYASVAPTPIRVREVEEMFAKEKPLPDLIEDVISVVKSRISPISDVRASAEYRLHLVEVLTRMALFEVLGGVQDG